MIETLSLFENTKEASKVFKRRDAEGKLIINNVLLNGHVEMLDYILTNWKEANQGINLSLEG